MPAPLLFALDSGSAFAAQVAAGLGEPLAPLEERNFEDGEHKVRPLVAVGDRDVYVLEPLYATPERSADDRLVRLLFFVGALKDAGAARVTALVPYLAYARKDRRSKPHDPVATRYVAQLFEAVGIDTVVTIDVHNVAAFQNAFRCRTENLAANPLLVRHFAAALPSGRVVAVAPDVGAVKRTEQFRRALEQCLGRNVGMAFVEKHRSSGEVTGAAFVGDVAGAAAIIVDDMISAGTTVARAAGACRARGATRVYAAVTHALFAGEANAILPDAALDGIVATDTVAPWRAQHALLQRLTTIGVAPLFAEAVRRLHQGESLVDLTEV